jgi:trans-aconitate 3-methyltransferase
MGESKDVDPNMYNQHKSFWEDYRAGRPKFPASFYDRFYTYHKENGGDFGTIYDVGAGPGEMSFELSKKFAHVIVGDPSPKSQAIAKDLLGPANDNASSEKPKFAFLNETIEECSLPDASVDAIWACTMMHWTEPEKAVETMARILKPGGTVFIAAAGIPRFEEKIQKLWFEFMDAGIAHSAKNRDPTNVRRTLEIADNGYDSIAFPEPVWRPGVQRIKLNTRGIPDIWLLSPQASKDVTPVSRVGPNDKLEDITDKEWFYDGTYEAIKANAMSYPFARGHPRVEDYLAKIEKALDGGSCEAWWPVSIIMATKK